MIHRKLGAPRWAVRALSYYRGGRTVSTRRRALWVAVQLTWNDLLRRPWNYGYDD